MGKRLQVFSLFILLLVPMYSFALADPGCERIARGVGELAGEEPVPAVEAIHTEQAERLARYSNGLSVQEQLQMEGAFGFASVRDEKIAGFVVAKNEAYFVRILNIAVAKGRQGQGIGRELVEKVIETAKRNRGNRDVRVLVADGDEVANEFFSHVGLNRSEFIPGKFDSRRVAGVLYKTPIWPEETLAQSNARLQLQLAPMPTKPAGRLAVQTIPITLEELMRLDPTLENAHN